MSGPGPWRSAHPYNHNKAEHRLLAIDMIRWGLQLASMLTGTWHAVVTCGLGQIKSAQLKKQKIQGVKKYKKEKTYKTKNNEKNMQRSAHKKGRNKNRRYFVCLFVSSIF
jgi:hypothetical protein